MYARKTLRTLNLHAYRKRILRMHKLKNRYTHARTSLRTCKHRLHMQEQVHSRKPEFAHARTNIEGCSSTSPNFSQPKHVPPPPRVSVFHLNPSQIKTQEFIGLNTDWNGRSKENLKDKKSSKNLLIWPLHPPKGVVVICRSKEEPLSALPLHSNKWDGKYRWRGCRNFS